MFLNQNFSSESQKNKGYFPDSSSDEPGYYK